MNLESLNPNVIIGSLVLSLLGTLWAKIRGKEKAKEDLATQLWHTLEGVVLKLAASDDTTELVRAKLTKAAYAALERLGVPKDPLAEYVIAGLVDRGLTEVRKQMVARENGLKLEVALDRTKDVLDAFDPPTNPKVPTLGIDVELVR